VDRARRQRRRVAVQAQRAGRRIDQKGVRAMRVAGDPGPPLLETT